MSKIFALILGILVFSWSHAEGLAIGQMRSAETSGWGSMNLTTGVGIFENVKHVFGTVRYGVASQMDISGSLALMDHEASDDASLLLNADLQYQFMQSKLGWSLDMAGGVVFEYYKINETAADVSIWSLGVNYVISKPFKMDNGFAFTPYARLNLRSDNYDVDVDEAGTPGTTTKLRPSVSGVSLLKMTEASASLQGEPGKESDFNIGVNVGSVVPLGGKVNLIGELLIDDEFGFFAGINFLMW